MQQSNKNLQPARHHWWPGSLSQFWADQKGNVRRLAWDGTESIATPYNFGALRNAHHIKMAHVPTAWDENFEPQFGHIDGKFPDLVRWLSSLDCVDPDGRTVGQRIASRSFTDEQFVACIECAVSLVVRSPAFRNRIRQTLEHLRGPLNDKRELDRLIAINQRDCQKRYVAAIHGRGKIAILISKQVEFIFGDGFFHNFTSTTAAPMTPRLILPLTPRVAIFYTRPIQYMSEPRAVTVSVRADEASFLNETVQVYSKDAIFYRTDRPSIIDEFRSRAFLEYVHQNHPAIDYLERAFAA